MTVTDAALAELLTLTVEVNEGGSTIYRNHLGQLHRVHGPAVTYPNGRQVWYLHGQRHRDHGPAIESVDGSSAWYQYGHLHRTDGPAIESPSYGRYWYLYDEKLSEEEFNERIKSL